MATLNIAQLTNSTTSWEISGLQNPFNPNFYKQCGVTKTTFANGAALITGIASSTISHINLENSVNPSKIAKGRNMQGLTTGTAYTLYGFAQAANGMHYQADKKITNIEDFKR